MRSARTPRSTRSALAAWTIPLAFLAFAVGSIHLGITRENIYTGPVGVWLGMFLVYALLVSMACSMLIAWQLAKKQAHWRATARSILLAWIVTALLYIAWEVFVDGQLPDIWSNWKL